MVDRGKIEVIHEGALQYDIIQSSNILIKNKIIKKEYFHCVGFFKEIKNPFRILEAFQVYKNRVPRSRVKLVLAGHVGGVSGRKILDIAKSKKDVIYVGRISDSELKTLSQHSLGLVFPSLYEGFGIPILEAQAYGCPVVTANVSSMPEVAGDGAIIVNPLDVNEIANAFKQMECENTSELINYGYKNILRFSWHKASLETMNVLKETLE